MKQSLWTAAILMLAACGGPMKYQIGSSPKAPGADAKLVADIQERQNHTKLEFEAEHLPPPARVAEGATSYIAWYRQGSKQAWQRIGGVEYDEGSREATLIASAPETSFDFEVTAESDGSAASPSADVVFSQRVEKK